MSEKKKRTPLGKRLRFEVFKRDQFTCQYCGRQAPDVVLQVDHLKPVAEGGTNEIMNLITSCIDCNQGKGAHELSDDAAIKKQLRQAGVLAARREQIEMLRDWYTELVAQGDDEVDAVDDVFKALTGNKMSLADWYKKERLPSILQQFGLALVLDALKIGFAQYGGDAEKVLDKLGGICACKKDPSLFRRGLLTRRMEGKIEDGIDHDEVKSLLARGYKAGKDNFLDDVEDLVNRYSHRSYWNWLRKDLYAIVEEYEDASS